MFVSSSGLDLVEQVERAGPREEQGEQERDRAERLLAAREEREALHLLAARAQLDLDPRPALLVAVLGLGQAEPALPAREERRRDLLEVPPHGRVRLGEPLLDRLGQHGPEPLQLGEALLEVRAL